MTKFNKDNETGENQQGSKANSPLKFLSATSIIGDKVVNPKGEEMGEIEDFMVNLNTGNIEYFVVEMGGFLGIGEKYFAFPFALLKLSPKNKVFILDQELETLKNAPGFDKDHWPQTNSHEYKNHSNYWGSFMGVNTGAVPY